jgi:hypothetical protein
MAMTNGRRITTKEAVIRTATIEIKTMSLNGKQVTQSVFRQLIKEELLDPETGELLGVPWGTVNYFPGDCKEADHLHVVRRGQKQSGQLPIF